MQADDPRQSELLATIRQGVDSALAVIGEIDQGFIACSKRLRVDAADDALAALSSGISDLGDLVDLVQQIRTGVDHLVSKPVPEGAFGSLEKSVSLFREMQAALEAKDWITLADLIQYELSPLLAEGKRDLAVVRDLLARP